MKPPPFLRKGGETQKYLSSPSKPCNYRVCAVVMKGMKGFPKNAPPLHIFFFFVKPPLITHLYV